MSVSHLSFQTISPAGAPRGRVLAVGWPARVVLAATLAGFALRLVGSRGELGLDELWTLHLVAGVSSLGGVFWGLSHDNNHFLNSAWLYLVGPGAPILIERLPAILLGALTVPAVARWLGRRSEEAGVLGAVLAAVALPLVDFGSEARGYAGLVLASVIALDEADRGLAAILSGQPMGMARRHAWVLAAAIGFGFLSHLGMVYTVATIALVFAFRIATAPEARGAVLLRASRFAWPSVLLTLPAAGCVVAGIVNRGGFTVGDRAPFSLAAFVDGFGGMLSLTGGVPEATAPLAVILATAGAAVLAWQRGLIGRDATTWAVAALVVLPGLFLAARLPNVGYARYYVICGIVLLALQAEALATAYAAGGRSRRWALALAAALVAGQLGLDLRQFDLGRGDFTGMAATMTAEGPSTYSTDYPAMGTLLLSARPGLGDPAPLLVPEEQRCGDAPTWYVALGLFDPRPDARTTVGPDRCRATYRRRLAFEAAPLSGTQATLYRRVTP